MCWNLYEARVTWNQFSYRESLVLFDSSHILSVLWSSKISSCSCFCSCAHSIRWFVNSFSRSFRRCSSRFNSSRSCSRIPRTFRRTCCEFSVAFVGHFEFSVFLWALSTSLDMGWRNVHPDFQNSSKNYFTSIPSDYGLGTENRRSLGYFCHILIFFKITEFCFSRKF